MVMEQNARCERCYSKCNKMLDDYNEHLKYLESENNRKKHTKVIVQPDQLKIKPPQQLKLIVQPDQLKNKDC